MSGTIVTPRRTEQRTPAVFSYGMVNALLEALDAPLFVAERNGRVLLMNSRARKFMQLDPISELGETNVFGDLLGVDGRGGQR